MKRLLLVAFVIASLIKPSVSQQRKPDLILTGGKIFTSEPTRRFAVTDANRPTEAITLEQAVEAYTRGSAFAESDERNKGTLSPGKLADLAVLSQDIFTAPLNALPATQSVLTLVGGKIIFDAGTLRMTR